MSTDSALRLVPLSLEHIDGVMSWVNDPEVTFYFARHGEQISREEELAFLEQLIASKNDIIYSIFEGEEYVGQIGLGQIYWPARNARLGCMLPRHAWGRGIASRAGRMLLARAFTEHNLHKVWCIVRSDNPKGLYLWSKLGFRCEGILRDEYFAQGRPYDMVRLACIATDFRSEG